MLKSGNSHYYIWVDSNFGLNSLKTAVLVKLTDWMFRRATVVLETAQEKA